MGLLAPHGHQNASADPQIVIDWWQREPDANIGIACGPSRLIVVDEDPRNGGDETLASLKFDGFQLPDTVTSSTGGGGHHYFYRRPANIVIKDTVLGPGVELKIGGYVVAPPSMHMSGTRYVWLSGSDPFDGVQIMDAPDWLIGRLSRDERTDTPNTDLVIDWSVHCPSDVLAAICRHPRLEQLWRAEIPLIGQKDDSPSTFRFLLQGQLAARRFMRQEVLDASIAFTALRSEHRPSDAALLNEIDEAFDRAREIPTDTAVALREKRDGPEKAVLDAVEHCQTAQGLTDKAKRLLVALSRYSRNGLETWCTDVRLAIDLEWAIELKPKGSRQVRRYKQELRKCGCITELNRPAPRTPVRYRLNTREAHPHRRTTVSYD